MAEIKELGESLLARQRKRNDEIYNRSKADAYKLAFLQAGSSLLSNSIRNKANDFLNNEELMAARAKQKIGWDAAQATIRENDIIVASGLTPQDYWENQMLPFAKQIALEQVQEQNMDIKSIDTLDAYVREQVRTLAQQKAAAHKAAYDVAVTVQSPEDYLASQVVASQRLNSNTNWFVNKVKGVFGGKSMQDLEQETIRALTQSSAVTNATAAAELRNVYAKTGSLSMAINASKLLDDGKITYKPEQQYWSKPEINIVDGPFGTKMSVTEMYQTNEQGTIVSGPDGKPNRVFEIKNIEAGPQDPEFTQIVNSLTEAEVTSQSAQMRYVLASQDQDTQEAYQEVVKKFSEFGYDAEFLAPQTAAMAKKFKMDFGVAGPNGAIKDEDSQRLASQVVLNRMDESVKRSRILGFVDGVDFTDVNVSSTPDSVEILRAINQLEQTKNPIRYTSQELYNMTAPLIQELGGMDDVTFEQTINELSTYPFLNQAYTPDGRTVMDGLYEMFYEPVETVPEQPPTTIVESPAEVVSSSERFKNFIQDTNEKARNIKKTYSN